MFRFLKIFSVLFVLPLFANTFDAKVGVLMPLTGDMATYGNEAKNGLMLAIEEISAQTPKLKFIIEDTQSKASVSATSANKLVSSDKVVLIIGDLGSTQTLAAAPIVDRAKIPMITPTSTSDTVTVGKNYVFRTCIMDKDQGQLMGHFSSTKLNAKTAVILEDSDSDYSKGMSRNFSATFQSSGGRILKVIKYSQADTSFTAQLTDVRKLKPNVIFIPGYPRQVGLILKEAKDLGIKSQFLGGDGWATFTLGDIAKGAQEGAYISSHFSVHDDNPLVQKFVKKYKTKFGIEPTSFAALTYDTVHLAFAAIKEAKILTPENIHTSLQRLKNFQGVTGSMYFDQNRNAVKSAVILQITDKGYKFIERTK